MHADSDTIEAKDAGLAICSRNAARICCLAAYKNKDGRVMASLVEVFDYLDFLGAL